jgi:hypothetical protein
VVQLLEIYKCENKFVSKEKYWGPKAVLLNMIAKITNGE